MELSRPEGLLFCFVHTASIGCQVSAIKGWGPSKCSKRVLRAPIGTPYRQKNASFYIFCPFSQKLFSNCFLFVHAASVRYHLSVIMDPFEMHERVLLGPIFLFRAYSFNWMSRFSHQRLDLIEILTDGPPGHNWDTSPHPQPPQKLPIFSETIQ